MAGQRFVKFEGEFTITSPDDSVNEVRKVIKESFQISEATYHRIDLDAATLDYQICFGGMTSGQARKIYMVSTAPVQVRLNDILAPQWEMVSTTVLGGKVNSVYITTGATDPATVEFIVAGL